MKVINLDKFRAITIVEIDGTRYKVKSVTVGMFLNDDVFAKLTDGSISDQREGLRLLIKTVQGLSDIPEEVLMEQTFQCLMALVKIAQGVDPTEEPETEGDSEGEKKAD